MQQDIEPAGSAVSPFAVPSFGPVFFAILLAMLAEAMAGSYIALLAVEDIGMSPLELSAFLTIPAARASPLQACSDICSIAGLSFGLLSYRFSPNRSGSCFAPISPRHGCLS